MAYISVGDYADIYYGGNLIHSVADAAENFILPTANKYLSGDLVFESAGRMILSVAYGGNAIINEATGGIYTLPASGKYLTGNITGTVSPTGRFPSQFTELEYIASTGSQYFDTGIVPDNNTKVECEFQLTENSNTNLTIFGVAGQYTFRRYSSTVFRTNGGNNVNFTNIKPDLNKHTVTKTATSTTLTSSGGVSETKTTTAGSCTLTLSIFAYHTSSGYSQNSSVKIYSFKIYSGTTLQRDYIPARYKNVIIGFYDRVSNTLYEGVGNLVAGPDV